MRETVSSIVTSLERDGDTNIWFQRAKTLIEQFWKDRTKKILDFYNQV